jgi:hypothetical protein
MAPPERPIKHKAPEKPKPQTVSTPNSSNPNISSDELSKLEVANIAKDLNKDFGAGTAPPKPDQPKPAEKPKKEEAKPKNSPHGELNADDTIYIDQDGTIHSINEAKPVASDEAN